MDSLDYINILLRYVVCCKCHTGLKDVSKEVYQVSLFFHV